MNSINKVVVLGKSSAGLLSAIALKTFFPQLQIRLLYSDRHQPIGVGESSTAWFPQFLHECLGISRQEFYQAVWPVWKLGIRFEWGMPQTSHFNYTFDGQFQNTSRLFSKSSGFYCMHDMKQGSNYSILMDKLHSPFYRDQQGQIKLLSEQYGYHFGVEELLEFLTKKAISLGVEVQQIEVMGAELNEDGSIKYLCCEADTQVTADLYIDCSGFKSQLLGNTLKEEFISFSDRLFCDSALAGNWKRQAPIFPFTTVTTLNSGWRWRIDLRDRVSVGYVYSSQFCSDDEATQEYLSLTPYATDNLRKICFKSGRYRRFWVKNVVAIGNACGFVEPLESTGQHMIAETIWRVILALQDSNLCPTPRIIESTNQYVGDLWDEICDFLTLHFKFNQKLDTPFWKHCRQATDLGAIQEFVDLYKDSGVCRILSHLVPKSSIFEIDGYLSILCGQQVPINQRFPMTETDKQHWHNYRQQLRQNLEDSISPQEAFDFLEKSVFS